jgi:putative transposase
VRRGGGQRWRFGDRRLHILLRPDTSRSSGRIARKSTALIGKRGKPLLIVSGNGTEITSSAIPRWS